MVELRTTEPTRWAEKGHVVAWEQFPIANPHPAPPIASESPDELTTVTEGDRFQVTGKNFAAVFDHTTGQLKSLRYGGREMLAPGGGPRLNLYRAPTDNDGPFERAWNRMGLRDEAVAL